MWTASSPRYQCDQRLVNPHPEIREETEIAVSVYLICTHAILSKSDAAVVQLAPYDMGHGLEFKLLR